MEVFITVDDTFNYKIHLFLRLKEARESFIIHK